MQRGDPAWNQLAPTKPISKELYGCGGSLVLKVFKSCMDQNSWRRVALIYGGSDSWYREIRLWLWGNCEEIQIRKTCRRAPRKPTCTPSRFHCFDGRLSQRRDDILYLTLLTLWSRPGSPALVHVLIFWAPVKSSAWTCFERALRYEHSKHVEPSRSRSSSSVWGNEGRKPGRKGEKKWIAVKVTKFKPLCFPEHVREEKWIGTGNHAYPNLKYAVLVLFWFFLSWSWRQNVFSRNALGKIVSGYETDS